MFNMISLEKRDDTIVLKKTDKYPPTKSFDTDSSSYRGTDIRGVTQNGKNW